MMKCTEELENHFDRQLAGGKVGYQGPRGKFLNKYTFYYQSKI